MHSPLYFAYPYWLSISAIIKLNSLLELHRGDGWQCVFMSMEHYQFKKKRKDKNGKEGTTKKLYADFATIFLKLLFNCWKFGWGWGWWVNFPAMVQFHQTTLSEYNSRNRHNNSLKINLCFSYDFHKILLCQF